MEIYTGDDMEVVISPELEDGEARVVLITQDESIFQAHDGNGVPLSLSWNTSPDT